MSRADPFEDEIAQSRSLDLSARERRSIDVRKLHECFSKISIVREEEEQTDVSEEREDTGNLNKKLASQGASDGLRDEMEKLLKAERRKFTEEIAKLKQSNKTLSDSLRKTKNVVDETLPDLEKAVTEKEKQTFALKEKDAQIVKLELQLQEAMKAVQRGREKRAKEMEDLNRRVNVALNMQTQKESELSTVASNSEKLYETLKDTQKMLDDARASNTTANKIRKEQEAELLDLRWKIMSSTEQIKKLEENTRDLQARLDSETNQRKELEHALEQQTTKMKNEVEELTSNNQTVYQSLKNTQQLLDDTRKTNSVVSAANEEQRLRIVSMTEQIIEHESKIDELETSNAELIRKFDYALKKNASMQVYLEDEKEKFCSEISYWKSMNEKLFESLTSTKGKVDEAQKVIQQLELKETKQEATIAELASQIIDNENRHNASNVELVDKVQSLERQNESLKNKYDALAEIHDEHREKYAELNDQKLELEHSTEKQKTMIQDLHKKLRNMRSIERENDNLREQVTDLSERNQGLKSRSEATLLKFEETTKKYRSNYCKLVVKNEELMKKYEAARGRANERTAEALKQEMTREAETLDKVFEMSKKTIDLSPLTLTNNPSFTYERKNIDVPESSAPFLQDRNLASESLCEDSLDASTHYASVDEVAHSSSSSSSDGDDETILLEDDQSPESDSWFWDWMEPNLPFGSQNDDADADEDVDGTSTDDDESDDDTEAPKIEKNFDYM